MQQKVALRLPFYSSVILAHQPQQMNIVRAMDDADANTQIEFIAQYRPELTTQHLQVAEEIGIEVISTFEFIDGFLKSHSFPN